MFYYISGSPCPPFKGFPLDPPIRSRFQALYDAPVNPNDLYYELKNKIPDLPFHVIQKLILIMQVQIPFICLG